MTGHGEDPDRELEDLAQVLEFDGGLQDFKRRLQACLERGETPETEYARQYVAAHLCWFGPGDWTVLSTILSPEADPLSIAYCPEVIRGRPYEIALFKGDENGQREHVLDQRLPVDRAVAAAVHEIVLNVARATAVHVVHVGPGQLSWEQIAADFDAQAAAEKERS